MTAFVKTSLTLLTYLIRLAVNECVGLWLSKNSVHIS